MTKGNILITGVSSGIGYYAAKKFIDEGYTVYGSLRKQSDVDRLKEDFGAPFHPLLFDVTDEKSIVQASQKLHDEISDQGLLLLINNSGIAVVGPTQHLSTDDFRYQFEVNFFGMISVTNSFLPLLGARKDCPYPAGKIFNISSVSSTTGLPYMNPYSSSKAAMDAFTDGLRRELMVYDIDVINFNPGPVKTPIWDKVQKPTEEIKNSVYGRPILAFHKLVFEEAVNAINIDVLTDKLYDAFNSKKPPTAQVVMRNKFIKYTIPRLILSKRVMDKIFYKMLKMRRVQ